jgi:succinate dehydrogenase (ubiquinone) flavoprotein subunit
MKHTLSTMPDLNSKVKLQYRKVVTHTLDEKEMPAMKPFARVY